MEQVSNETIEKSLNLLNHLYKNNTVNKDTYETILPTININSYNFVALKIYKNLLVFLKPKLEDLHYLEFFNLEREKHYQEYIKLFSAYNNYPPFLL